MVFHDVNFVQTSHFLQCVISGTCSPQNTTRFLPTVISLLMKICFLKWNLPHLAHVFVLNCFPAVDSGAGFFCRIRAIKILLGLC